MKKDHTKLEKQLGYTFTDQSLLEKALTHRSYRYEQQSLEHDNQRLEFLGDAALGLVAADYLFRQYHDVQEGVLSRLRSAITNSSTLAIIARELTLGDYLLLGIGERASGGTERDSNLGDCLEAVLGAIYLDGGTAPVRAFFERFFTPRLKHVLQSRDVPNPKGLLQEFSLWKWQVNPEYCLLSEEGPDHNRRFVYAVMINGQEYGRAAAGNKRKAQSLAAQQAIHFLEEKDVFQIEKFPLHPISEL
jgi:ribonuclease-3